MEREGGREGERREARRDIVNGSVSLTKVSFVQKSPN
jgi:hypothetical protein